ncbi:RNA-binding protein [Candidatus Peregrinibacteria bacterium CG11_big_fil_rev_8_21_14_0_20_41_10]|nr:MAG: RNA-binding protein [Candidatus Peregrinibacteria bacterium CG11_big_fil_rev_8_21_14_0_20_41_10]PIZ74295.1 MAG: RNA-binding protein [Candidatus Peregrinibacteria bacterium CG_4_10_14_0_2_um_filter_41_8]
MDLNADAANTTKDRDFVEFVIKSIVDYPEQVEILRTIDDLGILITVKVAKDDMGKVVGRNGQTAKAMRVLLRLVGSQESNRVNLKILEPDGSEAATGMDDEEENIFG